MTTQGSDRCASPGDSLAKSLVTRAQAGEVSPQIPLSALEPRRSRRRVICGCMFHHEVAALDWRVHELRDVVDEFVVVESTRTHSGLARQLVHPERHSRFSDVRDRLHVFIDDHPPEGDDPWVREQRQREAIWTVGASSIATSDDDLILLSDVDEVPFPEVVDRLSHSSFDVPILVRPHWFNFNWDTYLGAWDHASIRFYPAGLLSAVTRIGQSACIGACSLPGLELEGLHGWHASWFGTNEFILDKLMSYSHAEEDRERRIVLEGGAGLDRRRTSGRDLHGSRRKVPSQVRLPVHAGRISDRHVRRDI